MAEFSLDDSDITLPASAYRQEKNLNKVVAFSPDEQADSDRIEANPDMDTELDGAIARAKNPRIKEILLKEKADRAAKAAPAPAQSKGEFSLDDGEFTLDHAPNMWDSFKDSYNQSMGFKKGTETPPEGPNAMSTRFNEPFHEAEKAIMDPKELNRKGVALGASLGLGYGAVQMLLDAASTGYNMGKAKSLTIRSNDPVQDMGPPDTFERTYNRIKAENPSWGGRLDEWTKKMFPGFYAGQKVVNAPIAGAFNVIGGGLNELGGQTLEDAGSLAAMMLPLLHGEKAAPRVPKLLDEAKKTAPEQMASLEPKTFKNQDELDLGNTMGGRYPNDRVFSLDENGIGYDKERSQEVADTVKQASEPQGDLFTKGYEDDARTDAKADDYLNAKDEVAQTLKRAEMEHDQRAQETGPDAVARQKEEGFRDINSAAIGDAVEVNQGRGTALSEAFLKAARKKQGGAVDISPLGKVADYIRAGLMRRVGEDHTPKIVYRASEEGDKVQPGQWVTPSRDIADNVYGKGTAKGRVITDALPAKDLYEVHPGGWIYAPEGTDISGVVRHPGVTMGDVLAKTRDRVEPTPMPSSEGRSFGGRSPLGGVGKKQGGAIDLNAMLGKDSPEHDKPTWITQGIVGRINESVTGFKSFLDTKFPEWQDKHDDVSTQLGVSTSSFRSTNRLINHVKNAHYWVLKYFDDGIHLAKETERNLNEVVKSRLSKFNKNYGLGPLRAFDLQTFKQDIDVALKMEKNSATWYKEGGEYIPTVEQLKAHGMSEASAKVWRGMHEALDLAWNVLEATATLAGRKVPERVPGYVPHVFKGPYSVVLRERIGPGEDDFKYHAEFNSFSRRASKEQERILQEHIKGDPNFEKMEIVRQEPTAGGANNAALIEGMRRAQDITQKNAGLQQLLQSIYEGAAQGIVSAVLDRNNVTKVGHALERVNMDGPFGLTNKHAQEAAKSMGETIQAINGWYARVKFVNEKLFQMDKLGMLDKPELRKQTSQYLESFMRISNSGASGLDSFVRGKLITAGLDPALAHNIANVMHSGFAKFYLFAKPAFYLANAMQVTISLPVLMTIKAIGQTHGEATGSIMKAMKDAVPDGIQMIYNSKNNELLQYARARGHIDPTFMDSADPGMIKDPISVYIERQTRGQAFLLGYHYFKQFMSEAAAKEAAGKFSDTISVPYGQSVGAPIAFNKGPRLIAPFVTMFGTYNVHMMNLMGQQLRTAVEAGKSGNASAVLNAAAGAIGLQALNWSLFGIGGLALTSNWDDMASWLNKKFGVYIPTTKETARTVTEGQDKSIRELISYGAPSTVLGYDISSSGAGAGFQSPMAGIDAIHTMGQALYLGLRQLSYGDVTRQEAGQWVHSLPAQWRGMIEPMIKEKDYGDIIKKIKGELADNAPMPKDIMLPSDYERSRSEYIASLSGLRSLGEADAMTSMSIDARQHQNGAVNVERQIRLLKEGDLSDTKRAEVVDELMQTYYKDPDSILKQIEKFDMDTNLNYTQRKELSMDGHPESAMWLRKWLETQGAEPTRTP